MMIILCIDAFISFDQFIDTRFAILVAIDAYGTVHVPNRYVVRDVY